MEIFVGNLPFSITEQEIRDAFAPHGTVDSVKMLMDKFSGRFRGIAFVVMSDDAQAQAAIAALNGVELGGRPMRVDQSRERTPRFNGFGGSYDKKDGGEFRPRRGGFRPRRNFGDGENREGFKRDGDNRGGFRPRRRFGDGEGRSTFRPRRRFDDRNENFSDRNDNYSD